MPREPQGTEAGLMQWCPLQSVWGVGGNETASKKKKKKKTQNFLKTEGS